MDHPQQTKEIISTFIHKDASEISATTVIDRSACRSSIHVHRMYAALAALGVVVDNPHAIRTFGDLQLAVGSKPDAAPATDVPATLDHSTAGTPFIGIDIEEISSFTEVNDYREAEFYKQNFSNSEIAWCIVQAHPPASFAGKFAAKEAIVKADNRFASVPFNRIEILNAPSGKPQFKGFEISISHTSATATAVAVRASAAAPNEWATNDKAPACDRLLWLVAIGSFLLALAALFIR